MKSFIGALFIFLLVSAFVVCNMFSVRGRIDEMMGLAEELEAMPREAMTQKAEGREAMEKLKQCWDKSIDVFSQTMGYSTIDRVDDAMNELASGFENGEEEDCRTALAIITDALSRMRKLESFCFHSLL